MISSVSCSSHYKQARKAENRKKELKATNQQRYKETEKEYLAAVEKHNKRQSKATRKQMEAFQRKSDEHSGINDGLAENTKPLGRKQ
jgi:pyruvate formate-lyase activating enzyme-like uncharacterized protein